MGVGLIVGNSLIELGGGELHLPVGVDLVDANDVAAPAFADGPEAEGACPEIGVDFLGGDFQLRGDALAEMAYTVGVVPVKIFAHRGRAPFPFFPIVAQSI